MGFAWDLWDLLAETNEDWKLKAFPFVFFVRILSGALAVDFMEGKSWSRGFFHLGPIVPLEDV